MSQFAINTKYVDLVPLTSRKELIQGFKGKFDITSKLENLDIKENDRIIIANPEDKDLRFVAEGVVTKAGNYKTIKPTAKQLQEKKTAGLPPPVDSYSHEFYLTIARSLQQNNALSDLEYSLKSVYSFNNPIVHFHQQFRDLKRDDYDTIVHGWVYAARTVFGKFINALPRQNKLEFMLQAMDHFSTVDFSKTSLFKGLEFLYKYLDDRVLKRGRLLVATNNLMVQHLSSIIGNVSEIGFADEKGNFNNISDQAKIFEKIFRLEKNVDLRAKIKTQVSENSELEQRFLQIFKNETWPIDLSN